MRGLWARAELAVRFEVKLLRSSKSPEWLLSTIVELGEKMWNCLEGNRCSQFRSQFKYLWTPATRLLHFVLLAFNALSLKILSFLPGASRSTFANRRNAIAVLLVASQKTLPVMVAVVDQLGGALGAAGLLVLPGVAAHLNQIILDSFLVNSLLQEEHPVRGAKVA